MVNTTKLSSHHTRVGRHRDHVTGTHAAGI